MTDRSGADDTRQQQKSSDSQQSIDDPEEKSISGESRETYNSVPPENDKKKRPISWRKGYLRCRIRGENFDGRRKNYAGIKAGDEVLLIREPQNKMDPNAILVTTTDGLQLGYVERGLAKKVVQENGQFPEQLSARILQLTGGYAESGVSPGAIIEFIPPNHTIIESQTCEENSLPEPVYMQIAGSRETMDIFLLPEGRYMIFDRNDLPLGERDWNPHSPGLLIIWKSLIKEGYRLAPVKGSQAGW